MEKTGNTEKLKYEFNTAANLELFMPNLNGLVSSNMSRISFIQRKTTYKQR
jgi:hypothetical protein